MIAYNKDINITHYSFFQGDFLGEAEYKHGVNLEGLLVYPSLLTMDQKEFVNSNVTNGNFQQFEVWKKYYFTYVSGEMPHGAIASWTTAPSTDNPTNVVYSLGNNYINVSNSTYYNPQTATHSLNRIVYVSKINDYMVLPLDIPKNLYLLFNFANNVLNSRSGNTHALMKKGFIFLDLTKEKTPQGFQYNLYLEKYDLETKVEEVETVGTYSNPYSLAIAIVKIIEQDYEFFKKEVNSNAKSLPPDIVTKYIKSLLNSASGSLSINIDSSLQTERKIVSTNSKKEPIYLLPS